MSGDSIDTIADNVKILVVDDEEVIREIATDMLQAFGYKVTAVENANKGLSELLTNHYNVCITDYSMPGCTGVQMIKDFKEQKGSDETKFIGTSGLDAKTAEPLFNEQGAYFLEKPYNLPNLISSVKKASGN